MRSTGSFVSILMCIVLGCSMNFTSSSKENMSSPNEDDTVYARDSSPRPAHDFDLTLFSGDIFKLSDFKGSVVVLNFWGSYCVPCRWEMPAFEAVSLEYQDRGVVFVGIAVGDTEDAAMSFANEVGVTYRLGLDEKGAITINYGVTELPTTYIIDRDGNQVRKFNVANEAVLRLYLDGQIRSKS